MEILKQLLPKLTPELYKGSCGRILIIGGCKEYTGAPYFAGISAIRMGADLVHVLCDEAAAVPIKCYSPSLIVHPDWHDAAKIDQALSRCGSVVMGCGMGRSELAARVASRVFDFVAEHKIPAVFDGDATYHAAQLGSALPSLPTAVFTPNKREFDVMLEAFFGAAEDDAKNGVGLARALMSNVLRKGVVDTCYLHGQRESFELSSAPSPRRSSGQGDILAGILGVLLCWQRHNPMPYDKVCEAASAVLRAASSAAFTKIGRSMTAEDVIAELPAVIQRADAESLSA